MIIYIIIIIYNYLNRTRRDFICYNGWNLELEKNELHTYIGFVWYLPFFEVYKSRKPGPKWRSRAGYSWTAGSG